MTSKTNTTKTKSTKKPAAVAEVAVIDVHSQTDIDFKNALLIVSLMVNVIIFVAWLTLKVTSQFDHQIAFFLFYR